MAARTTSVLVGGIIELDDTIDVSPFIDTANLLVNRLCVPATDADDNPYYTDDNELEMIERWLAAHFYAIRDPRNVVSTVESLVDRFESRVDLHLDITRYGQQAMFVDTSGALAEYNRTIAKGPIARRRVGVTWLGQEPDTVGEVV